MLEHLRNFVAACQIQVERWQMHQSVVFSVSLLKDLYFLRCPFGSFSQILLVDSSPSASLAPLGAQGVLHRLSLFGLHCVQSPLHWIHHLLPGWCPHWICFFHAWAGLACCPVRHYRHFCDQSLHLHVGPRSPWATSTLGMSFDREDLSHQSLPYPPRSYSSLEGGGEATGGGCPEGIRHLLQIHLLQKWQ